MIMSLKQKEIKNRHSILTFTSNASVIFPLRLMNLNQSAIRQYYQFRHFVEKTKNYIYVHVSGLIESAIFGLAHVTAYRE